MSSDSGQRDAAASADRDALALWRAAAGAPVAAEAPPKRGPAMWLAAAGVRPASSESTGPEPPAPEASAPASEDAPTAGPRRRRYVRPAGAPLPIAPQDRPAGATDRYVSLSDAEVREAEPGVTRPQPPADATAARAEPGVPSTTTGFAEAAPPPDAGAGSGSGSGSPAADVVRDVLAGAFDRVDESGLGEDWDGLFDSSAPGDVARDGAGRAGALGFGDRDPGDDPLERAILQLAGEADAETAQPSGPPSDMPSDAGTWARDAERLAQLREAGRRPADLPAEASPATSGFPTFGPSLEGDPSNAGADTSPPGPASALARVALLAARQPPKEIRERWAGHSILPTDASTTSADPADPASGADGESMATSPDEAELAAGVLRRRRTPRPSRPSGAFATPSSLDRVDPNAHRANAGPDAPPAAAPQHREPLQGAGVVKRRPAGPPSTPPDASDASAPREPLRGAGVLRRRRTTTGAPAVVGEGPDDLGQK